LNRSADGTGSTLPASEELLVNQLCDEFEDAWKSGRQPRLEDYLNRAPAAGRGRLLRELLCLDYHYHCRLNRTFPLEAYKERFPEIDAGWLVEPTAAQDELAERPTLSSAGMPPGAVVDASSGGGVRHVGRRLGDYELLEEIAHGGMGVVYRARQLSLNRIVAVKLIRSGELASEKEFQRFQVEAEAAASLDHPHIVPVYEIGSHQGIRYLALKLIEGGSLGDRLDELSLPGCKKAQANGFDADACQQRIARLLSTVARAVHYAHQRGILHRDLKPSNILLQESGIGNQESGTGEQPSARKRGSSPVPDSRFPIPFVTDFGLAKRIETARGDETAELTKTGMILGTPSYMAPEQARGEKALTTAADVYALGAILYQLLTDAPPFQAETPLDVLVKLKTEEPIPPRQKQPEVAADLETVCLKCLRKPPPERYASAQELAEDLARFERGEPIRARPVSNWEKTWRWCRRNKRVAGLLIAIAGLLLVATVLSTALAAWALAERTRADENAVNERDARGLAEGNLAIAEQAVEDFLDKIEDHPRLREADFLELRRELLTSAVPFYDEFVKQKPGDADLERRRGRAYARLGFLHSELGNKQNAVEDFQKMRAIFRSLAEAAPGEPEHRWHLARSHNRLGSELRDLSRREEAQQEFLQALKISTELVAEDGAVPKYRLELARAHGSIAVLLREWGKPLEAERERRRAVELQEKLAADHPMVPDYAFDLARGCNNLGGLLRDLGRLEDAVGEFHKALKLCEPKVNKSPELIGFRLELARSHRFLGVVLGDLGRRNEAEAAYRQSIPHYKRLADGFPAAPRYRHELSMSHNSLGLLLQGMGRPKEAEAEYRAAINLQQHLVDGFPGSSDFIQSLARSRHNLGNVLVAKGQRAEGEKEVRLALALHKQLMDQEPALPEHKSSYGSTLHDLARCLKDRGDLVEARRLLEQAVQHQRQAYVTAPKHPIYSQHLQKHYWELAHANLDLGAHQQAADAAKEYSLVRPQDAASAAGAAEVMAWCITVVGNDRQLTPETQRERVNEYAARSMVLLTEAIRRGYTNLDALKRSKAFAPMRDRPDFQKLLEDLEAKLQSVPKPP
jgi:serine/threonine-protein kinase